MVSSIKKKRAVFVVLALLFSFLFALPAVLSAETCELVTVDTISDLIAAEKIRLGQRMEGVPQLSVVRSGDAADKKKMYAVLNSFFAEPQKAVPVRAHKQRVAAKLSDAMREPSLDSLVEKEIAVLADAHGEENTLLSLTDLFYFDKKFKGRNYFSPDKVTKAVETLRVPQEQKQKIVRVMELLNEEILKRKDLFQPAGRFDLEKLRAAHREALSSVISSGGVSQSELLDMMGTILARQSGEGSVTAVSGRNIESLLQFDEVLDEHILKNGLQTDAKVVGLLGDIEPALSVRMARKGSASSVEMAYISRSSMMSDGEKLAHYDALRQNPSLALDESLLDQGLVYNKIYRKNPDGTEAGIFVESKDEVKKLELKPREAELSFRDNFKTRLEQLLDSDPEFAKEAERIYTQLRLGDEDVVFIDTGFKGTIPTFLAAMHRIKHPDRRALTYLYGVKDDFAEIIPHFAVGGGPVLKIQNMGKFSDIGAFSPVEGALVGKTSPKDQLLASIDQFLIGKAGRGHESIPQQPLRPVPRDVEPLPIQRVPVPEPDAAPTNKGYASRREILDDIAPFTRFLDDNEFAWAVSGSGGIADELAAVGQRTGDADILVSSLRSDALDRALRQRAAAGTLEEIGIREYKPIHYNPLSLREGVRYETTAKGSIVLMNGQEIDLLAGMGYGVTDEKAIRQGFLEIAPGIRAPVKLAPTGKGYRAVVFDLDEFGNPTIPSFFKKGEDGRQFMTLDALHAKYSFEKRADRVTFVEELRKRAPTRQLSSRERSIIGFVETSGLSVDYKNAWNAAKAGKDVKIKRYGDYYRAKYAGDNAYLADGILAEARPEFAARIDAIADEFNALPLAERQKRVDEFIGRMEEVIQGKGVKAAHKAAPEIVAANRAALGITDDAPPALHTAVDHFSGSIVCKTSITGAAVGVSCPNPVALVRNVGEEKDAQRIQKILADHDVTLKIERSADFSEIIPLATPNQAHFEKITRLMEEGKFVDAQAYLKMHAAELPPSYISALAESLSEKQKALDDILRRASLDINTELSPEKNKALQEAADAVVKRLKPTHVADRESAQAILRNGKIISLKKQGISNRYYTERGLEDAVFFSFGGPFEHFTPSGPVFVARKDILKVLDFEATPFDSKVYDDVAEITGNSISEADILNGYLKAYIQNEGTLPSLRTVRGRKLTPFPEVRFKSEVLFDDIETVIVSPEDYKLFITDPAIPENTKSRLINSKWFGTDDTTEAYYKYAALDCVRNAQLGSASI